MKPNFSIIVLFHSGEGLLNACLDSLIATIQSSDEVIVVVNTPDEKMHSLTYDDKRVKFHIFKEALGHAGAANKGIAIASNEYVIISDHDLVYEPNWTNELWGFYNSSPNIAAVSCCVLNSHTDNVLDFGISYSEFNGAHPFLDLPQNHPLVSSNRCFQAVCTGGMLISKSTLQQLNGFDVKLGTLYSDVDLCLRLKAKGLQVGAAVKAKAYHFGGCFSSISRSYKASALKADVKGYFYMKNAHLIEFDLAQYYIESAQYYQQEYHEFGKYFFCNILNVANPDWYVELLKTLGCSFYDGITRPTGNRDSQTEGLYEHLGHHIALLNVPLIILVDRFTACNDNKLWWKLRNNKNDIIVDRNANIVPASSLN